MSSNFESSAQAEAAKHELNTTTASAQADGKCKQRRDRHMEWPFEWSLYVIENTNAAHYIVLNPIWPRQAKRHQACRINRHTPSPFSTPHAGHCRRGHRAKREELAGI